MPELNEAQVKQYNTFRAAGISAERALAMATEDADNKYNPVLEAGVDNVLFGKGSLTEAVGRGLKNAAFSGFKTVYDDTQQHGAGFALLKSPLSIAAGLGRGVGDVVGGALETADDLTGEITSDFLQPYVESAVNSDVGQYLMQKAVELDANGRGIPSDILDTLNLVGLGALVKSGAASTIKNRIVNVTKEAFEGSAGIGDDVRRAGDSLSDFLSRGRNDAPAAGTLDELIDDVDAGKTTENINPLQRPFVKEESLLTPAEKKRLLGVAPEEGNRYIEAFKKSETDDTAQSIFDLAVEDTLKVVEDYKAETSKIGSEIGKIKQKLTELPVDPAVVKAVRDDLVESLAKKNVILDDEGKFILAPGKNSPFSQADVAALNNDVLDALRNIENSSEMNELLLAMESLDSKINFSRDANVSSSLQGVSKTLRAKLKGIRDGALSPDEAKQFEAYSNAVSFADEFLKSDSRVSILLNRLGTKHSRDSLAFVKELQRVTGVDVQNYSALARILTEATIGSGRNKSLLQQHLTNAGIDAAKLTSPSGIIDTIVGGTIRAVLDVDKLKEIQKAINATIKEAGD